MRTLASALQTEVAKTTGAAFRLLMQIDAPGQSTRRLSTIDVTPSGGVAHVGELLGISELDASPQGANDVRVRVFDSAANRAVVKLGAAVELRLYAIGTNYVDADEIIVGTISDPIERSGGSIAFDVISRAERHDRAVGRLLNQAEFPGAVTLDLGKVLPVTLGTYERVEAIPVDAGAVTQLAVELDDSTTTLELTDASAFPSSGTVQIDVEQVSYTSKSGNTLSGGARSQNGTAAAAHLKGANIAELQSAYEYLIADHAIDSVAEVYVEGVRQVGVTSQLSGAITDSATSLVVDNAVEFPDKGSVKINSEWIAYESRTTTTLNTLTRAQNGTTAAAHSDNDSVEAVEWQIDVHKHGADLITTGDFATDDGAWVDSTGWDINTTTAGKAHCDGTQSAPSPLFQLLTLEVGRQYLLTYTLSGYVAGSVRPYLFTSGPSVSANGTYTVLLTANTLGGVFFLADADFVGDIDDVQLSLPYAALTFYAAPVLERLSSIELLDTIDVSDPKHSHEGASGSMTGAHSSTSLTGNPNLIQNPTNINASTANYARQQWLDNGTNSSGTITFTLSSSTTGLTPVSATVQIKAAKTLNTGAQGSFSLGSGGKWAWNTSEFHQSQANLEAGSFTTVSKSASISSFSELTSMSATFIGPAVGGADAVDVMRIYSIAITSVSYQEEGLQDAFTGVSKTGTVSITGNTTSTFVIGRDVSVDMDGFVDDSVGEITGSAGALIERPDHVARVLLRQFGGATFAETASADFDAFTSEALALSVQRSQERVATLLAKLRTQSRAFLAFNSARWYMRKRPDDQAAITTAGADFTLADAQVIRGEDGASTIAEAVVGLSDVANRLFYRAGPRDDGGYEASGVEQNATSQANYGVREATLDLDLIRTSALAATIAQWHVDRLSEPDRVRIAVLVSMAQYAIEIGDTVSLTSTKLASVSVVGEVVSVRTNLSGSRAGLLELVIEEAAP